MRNLASFGILPVLAAMIAACGGVSLKPATLDGGAGAGGGSSGSEAGSAGAGGNGGAGTAGGGATVSPCPGQPPIDGTDCTHEGLSCGWGDDPRGDRCRTQATCSSTQWHVTSPNTTFCTPLQAVGACPTDTVSAPCTMDTTCAKSDGNPCRCTNCAPTSELCGATTPSWNCPPPVTTAGCPAAEPNFGTPCASEGVECAYFWLDCGHPDRVCSHGVWTPGQILGCPTSSRRVKKDIRYLSLDEVKATASQALRLRLATYEYKAAPYAGRRHLGFIIEDSPNVPAVDRDGDMVDLYGYASMLVATTQAQQRQIEALNKQVEVLSRTVERMSNAGALRSRLVP
jgi:hypothetical protein